MIKWYGMIPPRPMECDWMYIDVGDHTKWLELLESLRPALLARYED
jgi:hypothetical protein